MSDQTQSGMTPAQALRLEAAIIGLGLLALVLIFQPFSLALFGIGSGLVVLAALVNNLLPLAEPGVPARLVAIAALLVAAIFCTVLLVAIGAAHLYGAFFLKAPDPDTAAGRAALAAASFYAHPLVWSFAAIAAALWAAIARLTRRP
jgi:hypothetical protein